jgi:hypothetical protein
VGPDGVADRVKMACKSGTWKAALMQELWLGLPFAGVGLALIALAAYWSHQTTLSARRLNKMVADAPGAGIIQPPKGVERRISEPVRGRAG